MHRNLKRFAAVSAAALAIVVGTSACDDSKACAATLPAAFAPPPAPRVYVPPPMPRYIAPAPAPRPVAPAPRPYTPSRPAAPSGGTTVVHHDNGMSWLPFWLIASQNDGGRRC